MHSVGYFRQEGLLNTGKSISGENGRMLDEAGKCWEGLVLNIGAKCCKVSN